MYPLDRKNRGRDTSGNRNPPAILVNVKPTRDPKGRPDGALSFPGKPVGYVKIPKSSGLSTRADLTYMLWVLPTGRPGTIISHGLTLRIDKYRRLRLSINLRLRIFIRPVYSRRRLTRGRWSLLAVVFRRRTFESRLYVNGRVWIRHRFRKYQPFTKSPVYIGGSPTDRTGFSGRIACVQFFKVPLSWRKILRYGKRCIRKFYAVPHFTKCPLLF